MNKAYKWYENLQDYKPYMLPNGAILRGTDMSAQVACAHCGEFNSYGNMYTSRRIHNHLGLGYAVCSPCYYEKDFGEKENAHV